MSTTRRPRRTSLATGQRSVGALTVRSAALSPYELSLVLASALLHALWSASIKQSGDPLCFNLLQLVFSFAALAIALPFFSLAAVPAGVWILLPATAVTHAFYSYWMCRAYEHGDL